MRVNLYLFKKDISPKNLPIFTSKEDRETYFSESNADKTYKNISYNGTRNIRINENAFEANLDYYNYARINWTDKEGVARNYYCFIDIVKYVNDNVSELQLTLDYVTTYYFDIKLNEFNLKQCTMQDSMRDRRGIEADENYRVYFENKIPCVYKPSKAIPLCHDIVLPDASCKLKWLIVNIAPSSSDTFEVYRNNGTEVISIITPAVYDSETSAIRVTNAYIRDTDNTDKDCDISSILRNYDGRILNISMIDNPFVDTEISVLDTDQELPTTLGNSRIYVKKSLDLEKGIFYEVYIPKNLRLPTTRFSYLISTKGESNAFVYMLSHIDYAIFFRTNGVAWINDVSVDYKYASLIKNGNEEVLQFSPQDFEMTENEQYGSVSIKISIDPIYPNNMMLTFKRDGVEPLNKKLKNVLIPAPISGIQFDQTKWGEYYVQNSASVNDGLATKHKYDLENADKQRTSSHIQGALNFVGGGASAMTGLLGAGMMENEAGLFKGAGQAISSVFNYAANITATEYAYQIAENNIQKEKELLQLSWNDIKASPNSMYNYGAGNNIISMIDYGYVLYIMEPVDMNNADMKKYHMIYGYKINRKFAAQDETKFKGINDIMLAYENKNDTITDIKYKFIRLESDFVIDNLPLTVRKMLKEIFADGVKFYNKDNMLISVNTSFNNYIE